MRSMARIVALGLVLLVLVVPLAAYASGGPCPDDPNAWQYCNRTAPPYYIVINRAEEHLWDRPGTGCQPFILKHPECVNCMTDPGCAAIDVDAEVCKAVMAMRGMPPGKVYVMCCDCAYPDGMWRWYERDFDGTDCPGPSTWTQSGLPPGTGIDLPVPLIVGGLAVIGAGLLAAGVLVRRRAPRTAAPS